MTRPKPLWLGTTDRYARLRRIESLNLETDYREIALLFYGDFQSVMFSKSFNGFMFNYAAPRISRTLSATGELERRVAKRVVDTTLLASEAIIHGFDEGRGRQAAQRVRAMHSRYAIREEEFIATGCEEVLGSLDLAERFGWRPVTEKERDALRLLYSDQARAFGSPKPLPGSMAELEAFFTNYLDTELSFEAQNRRLADAMIGWFCGLVPGLLRPMFRIMLVAGLDPRIARACGLKRPVRPVRWAARAALRTIGRQDPLPDGSPDGLEALGRSVYPDGWEINKLGTHLGAKPPASGRTPAAVRA